MPGNPVHRGPGGDRAGRAGEHHHSARKGPLARLPPHLRPAPDGGQPARLSFSDAGRGPARRAGMHVPRASRGRHRDGNPRPPPLRARVLHPDLGRELLHRRGASKDAARARIARAAPTGVGQHADARGQRRLRALCRLALCVGEPEAGCRGGSSPLRAGEWHGRALRPDHGLGGVTPPALAVPEESSSHDAAGNGLRPGPGRQRPAA